VCGDIEAKYGDAETCISSLHPKVEIENINSVAKNFYLKR
jgi:hypothetical protein